MVFIFLCPWTQHCLTACGRHHFSEAKLSFRFSVYIFNNRCCISPHKVYNCRLDNMYNAYRDTALWASRLTSNRL